MRKTLRLSGKRKIEMKSKNMLQVVLIINVSSLIIFIIIFPVNCELSDLLSLISMLLLSQLLTVQYTSQNPVEVQSDCNKDVLLQCSSVDAELMDYLAIAWYKVQTLRH